MAQVFHLVGQGGSRKTTVALWLALHFRSIGRVCVLVDCLGGILVLDDKTGDFEPAEPAVLDTAEVIFYEHYPEHFDGGKPGDVVLNFSVVPGIEPAIAPGRTQ